MFDVDKSTTDWLGHLKQSGALEDPDLEELESHLKDEIEQLVEKGLSEKEAFWVAASRLGNREELPEEYAKVNSRPVWRHRFLWMVAGILAFLVVNQFVWLLAYGTTLALVTVSSGIGRYPATALSVLLQIVLACLGLASAYFVLSRDGFRLSNFCRKAQPSRSRVIIFYATPAALLGVLLTLWLVAGPILLPRLFDSERLSTTWEATYWGSHLFSMLFAVSLAGLAFVLSRPKKSEPRLSPER